MKRLKCFSRRLVFLDVAGDETGDVVARSVRAHAHGMVDRLVRGGAVRDDHCAGNAEKRRAAVDVRIKLLLERLEGSLQQHRSEDARYSLETLLLEKVSNSVGQRLGSLKYDVKMNFGSQKNQKKIMKNRLKKMKMKEIQIIY